MKISDIKPSDIDTNEIFMGAFGKSETEQEASALVTLAQRNGDWRNLGEEEVALASENERGLSLLTRGNNPWIRINEDGSYSFTPDFIERCFKAAPATHAK